MSSLPKNHITFRRKRILAVEPCRSPDVNSVKDGQFTHSPIKNFSPKAREIKRLIYCVCEMNVLTVRSLVEIRCKMCHKSQHISGSLPLKLQLTIFHCTYGDGFHIVYQLSRIVAVVLTAFPKALALVKWLR